MTTSDNTAALDSPVVAAAMRVRNPLVIYPKDSDSGFATAWVFHYTGKRIGTPFEFHAASTGEPLPDVEGRQVYLAGFCYGIKQMRELWALATVTFIIGDSPMAVEAAADLRGLHNSFAKVSAGKSSAILAWEFWNSGDIIPDLPPKMLSHIADYDLQRLQLPATEQLMAALSLEPKEFDVWDRIMQLDGKLLNDYAHIGTVLMRQRDYDCQGIINSSKRMMVFSDAEGVTYFVPTCNAPRFLAAAIGRTLSFTYYRGDIFAATYYDAEQHRVFSLHSQKNGVDVSAIAKAYEGGGNANAAEFSVPRNHPLAQL